MPEILIVEDTESDAALLERALRAAGVANPISRCSNGADALAFIHSKQTAVGDASLAVIFIDLKLPDVSGFEILKLMQSRAGFAQTLRVVVSSLDDMENIKRAYTLGADSFIVKPTNQFDVKELINSFPEHWVVVDPMTASSSSPPESKHDPDYDQALRVWTENREIIQKLRDTFQTLRRTLNDNEETMTIVETLAEELRNSFASDAVPTATKSKKKRRTNLIL